MEDLHWADTSSIELLESIYRLANTQGILFVNVFRPDHKETGDRIVRTIKEKLQVYHVELFLKPFDEAQSEALVNNMLHSERIQNVIMEKIIHRSSGNPFFIEEVVRSLIDEHVIVIKDGVFRITDKIDEICIPKTINDVLMARIDSLEEKTRNLLRIASVIGRNFFYKVLSGVATSVEGMEDRLCYLKDIQIITEFKRTDDVEYIFKHGLTQEVAYESILPRKRRELHLRVAIAIEKVFGHRLHEFYGMIAYHYNKAGEQDKTEEYLIKAGKEALKSSASSEALHYYQKALDFYLQKYGDNVDLERVAMLEKNIALALYNRGQYVDAVKYFDKALNFYWGRLPKTLIAIFFKILSAFFHLLIALYIPSLKFRKLPTQQDLQIFDLFYKKCKALAITNPKQFFIEFIYLHKAITAFDLQHLENGTSLFVSASPLFSFSGISFRLSRRLLDFVKSRIDRDDVRTSTTYEICETMHNFLEGNWKEIGDYDEDLIKRNCDIGEFWEATQILYFHGLSCIYQGSFEVVESILNRLDDIFQVYQYDLAKTYEYELKSWLLVECRRFNDALIEIKKGIDFEEKSGPGFWELYVCKARIYISMGEIEKAEKCLEQADTICRQISPVPFQMAGFYIAKLEYNLYRLKEMLRDGNKTKLLEYSKRANRSVKILLKNVRKVAQYRTESYRLTGEFYWLTNNQKKALRLWYKAIKEGEQLGARPQLALVYVELGKRLLGRGSKYRVLDGITAEEYLEMARPMLKEMKLQSYLYELSQITGLGV
jgi:tetratricopeptide (TPR) repeat protein